MKIQEILNHGKQTLSFEIFPPKTGTGFEPVKQAAAEIAQLKPDFISVTYGAGGGVGTNTVKIASYVEKELGVTAIAHLTCVSSTKKEVDQVLTDIQKSGIQNILALRGDIPKDSTFPRPEQYQYAWELVRQIRNKGDFCIGGACYPEGHVECLHKEQDIQNLKVKTDQGCNFLTTQMFFDNNILYNFLYRIREAGIQTPVLAGIMPVTNGNQIKKICQLSGTVLPQRFKTIVDKYGDKPEAMKQAGIAYATEQIIDLLANGIHGIHVYSMNKPDIAKAITQNVSAILGKNSIE